MTEPTANNLRPRWTPRHAGSTTQTVNDQLRLKPQLLPRDNERLAHLAQIECVSPHTSTCPHTRPFDVLCTITWRDSCRISSTKKLSCNNLDLCQNPNTTSSSLLYYPLTLLSFTPQYPGFHYLETCSTCYASGPPKCLHTCGRCMRQTSTPQTPCCTTKLIYTPLFKAHLPASFLKGTLSYPLKNVTRTWMCCPQD